MCNVYSRTIYIYIDSYNYSWLHKLETGLETKHK
jgi:hypothetical protein